MKTLAYGILGVATLYGQTTVETQKKLMDEAMTQVLSRVAINGRPVNGAPYSGMSFTENTQVLADGNRIVNKTTSMHYRDSMGRERTENNIGADGVPMSIFISDPVEGVRYTLQPAAKVAVKNFMPRRSLDTKTETASSAEADKLKAEKLNLDQLLHAQVEPIQMYSAGGGAPYSSAVSYLTPRVTPKREDLGTQTREGVAVNGTRLTTTIPEGQMGNERPVVTVMERWFSPDLQVLIESTRTDPRSGTNTYKLTNIIRAEPAPTMFQVPADYTLKDVTRPSTKDEER